MGPSLLLNEYRRLFHRVQSGQGVGADHSPPSNAKVKSGWSYTSSPPICLPDVVKNNFAFYVHITVAGYKVSSYDRICGQAYSLLNFVNCIL